MPINLCHAGLVFVLRSEDGSAWWRDGGGNFNIPIPSSASPDEGATQASAISHYGRNRVIV